MTAHDQVELSRPANRMMMACSRCRMATFEGEIFCCCWAKEMFERYFADLGSADTQTGG